MKKRSSIPFVLITFLILTSCSSSDDSSEPDNLPEDETFDLTPPSWIIDNWLRINGNPNIGYKFSSNDIIIAQGVDNEISFLDLRSQAIQQGYDYILTDALETTNEYHVYTETIDPSTGETLDGTYPFTWKWSKLCPNAIVEKLQEHLILRNDDNPYLTMPSVNLTLDLSSTPYSHLTSPGNHAVVENQGVNGIVVFNVNNSLYTAFELSDPNHEPNNCSKMSIDGILASCKCGDNNSYDIVTGGHQIDECKYPMQQYSVVKSGDKLLISNY